MEVRTGTVWFRKITSSVCCAGMRYEIMISDNPCPEEVKTGWSSVPTDHTAQSTQLPFHVSGGTLPSPSPTPNNEVQGLAKRWLSGQEHLLLLQRILVPFPGHTHQVTTTTLAPGDPASTSDLCGHQEHTGDANIHIYRQNT